MKNGTAAMLILASVPTAYLVGFALALVVWAFARIVRLDRDGAFYPTVAVVSASYYVLFAVMGGSMFAVAVESVAMMAFVAMAVAGFKVSPWLVVVVHCVARGLRCLSRASRHKRGAA